MKVIAQISFCSLGQSFKSGEELTMEKMDKIRKRVPFLIQRGYIKEIPKDEKEIKFEVEKKDKPKLKKESK